MVDPGSRPPTLLRARTAWFLGVALACAGTHPAVAAPPSETQIRCIAEMNEEAGRLAKAHAAIARACAKGAAAGRIADAQGCLGIDPQGKVAKADARVALDATSWCAPPDAPEFGFASAAEITLGVETEGAALMADLFGPDLGAALVARSANASGARCQAAVVLGAARVGAAAWKALLPAKREALAAGAASGEELAAALAAALAPGSDPALARAEEKAAKKIGSACEPAAAEIAALVPGRCAAAASTSDLGACAVTAGRCRFCRALNEADGLALECDVFDDGSAAGSCQAAARTDAVYVSELGDDGNPGTQEEPLRTLGEGLARAEDLGFAQLLVAAGTYREPTLSLRDGVSISGGFDPEQWTPGGGVSMLLSTSEIALEAVGLATPTLIEGLSVVAAPGGPADFAGGGSSYGLRAEMTSGLTLRDCSLAAGPGGDGADGAPGADGADGVDGGPGAANGARGGGGSGGCNNLGNFGTDGLVGGSGGGRGQDGGPGQTNNYSCAVNLPVGGAGGGGCGATCPPEDGEPGYRGERCHDGQNGSGGGATGDEYGERQFFRPALGEAGRQGSWGLGGSGGGGGGGLANKLVGGPGGGGGGGGEGGCPGRGGLQGGGGGGSFAVYSFRSTLTIRSCTLTSDDGGDAGDGAPGGEGGAGGLGGAGGVTLLTGDGGRGGDGAPGGRGGNGGGGGGGPSFSVFLTSDSSQVTVQSSTLVYGTGGAAGLPNGQAGAEGPAGVAP